MSLKGSNEILDKRVFTQDGREVGTVSGLLIELDAWKVEALDLRLRREALEALHIERPLFGTRSARLRVEHVSGVTDTVILKLDFEGLASELADMKTEES